jgi:hypothetical protein
VPSWVPEGFELQELKTTPAPDGTKVWALLMNDSATITLLYRSTKDTAPLQYEKEDTAIEPYEFAEKIHLIMPNDDNLSVIWKSNDVECIISTDISKEEVYKMIRSIYRGELT